MAGQTGWMMVGEPALFARVGFERVKLELQARLGLPLAGEQDIALPTPVGISGGIIVDL